MDGDEACALEAGADGGGRAVLVPSPSEQVGERRMFEGRVEFADGFWRGRVEKSAHCL